MDRDKRGKKRVRAGRRTRGTRGRGYARSLDPRPSTAPVRLGSQPVQGGSNSDNFQQVQGGSNSDNFQQVQGGSNSDNFQQVQGGSNSDNFQQVQGGSNSDNFQQVQGGSNSDNFQQVQGGSNSDNFQQVQGGSNSDNFQQVQGGSNSDTSETDPLTYEVSLTHGSTLPNNASSISVKRAATSSISSDESPMAKKAKPSSPPIYISSGQSSPNALAFGRYKDGPISINSSVDSSTSSPNNVTRDFESPQPGPSNYDRSPQPGPSNYDRSPQPGPSNYDRSPQPGPSNYDRSPQPGPSNYDRSPQPGLSPTSPILPTLSPLSNISGMSPGYQNSPQPGPSGLHTNRQADDRHNYDTSETSEDSNESFAIEHLLMLINESGYDNSNDGARSRILDEDEVTSSTRPFEFVLPSPKVSHGEATSSTNTDNLTPPDDSTFSFRHLFQSSDEPPVSESKTMRYKYTVMN
ncbi:protein TE42 [Testudinid alphaherpesvirus 3]|uniref:Protein TE42 n=1 Tax=Testudinid alphaherpesvirus 3 TaxID=2560801 RepID=A0A0K1R1A1_9ALPH|nr:protein TE42 [Testudinid alphaherpesvirus 3]AIU39312.1 protein TE42 [Testudinid alphaherpesvirus 3]AKV40668.1 hypothetical protein [Testudinid alphaherpesvirus 3]